ncbi:MAG: alpha/beta fold hydrolase [Solirubrobacterales bacterium]
MPKLSRDDGVEIHWEERGDGPPVILAPYWSGHPSAFDPIEDELGRDHRVVRYDTRGTGESTRTGPHDIETAAADLEAIAEDRGGEAVVLALADACPRAVQVAATRPDLVRAVVAPGSAPLLLEVMRGADALLASETVIEAFIEMIGTDYRGALRTLMTQTNPQMDEEELRARVTAQADYCPAATALGRVEAWLADNSAEPGRAIGGRLAIVYSETMGGAWLPAGEEMARRVAEHLPEARLEPVDDGIVSRPDLTAAVVRSLSSAPGAAEGEK